MAYTYLALGDSYTIGEQVPLYESFPYQTVQLLRGAAVTGDPVPGIEVNAPEIIAKTGWTTDELAAAIRENRFLPRYDFVSLLIGVNNQYRERSVENYEIEFQQLLQTAIRHAGGQPGRVFVLSIPDWGVTPFAEGRDRNRIASAINAYNTSCKKITETHHCNFTDITASQRADGNEAAYLATDGLHPSGKEYAKWALQLSKAIRNSL